MKVSFLPCEWIISLDILTVLHNIKFDHLAVSEYISVNNTISHMGNGDHHISITITTITSKIFLLLLTKYYCFGNHLNERNPYMPLKISSFSYMPLKISSFHLCHWLEFILFFATTITPSSIHN